MKYTEIAFVLDRSGSMGKVHADTIGGFNSFLEQQKALPGEAKLTLVQFDNLFEVNYSRKNLRDAFPLTDETYIPRGMTALFDAIGRTIDFLGDKLRDMPNDQRPEKVIVAILTDGEENASREYTKTRIAEMIKHQQEKYSWEFLFLGANQDSFTTAKGLNISPQNVANYAATPAGVRGAYETIGNLTTSYRSQ